MSQFRAPGRVNLIGEHTDYNLGFVLPIALDLVTEVDWIFRGRQSKLGVSSENRETLWIAIEELASLKPCHQWTDYVIGVAQQLLKLGFQIDAKLFMVHSTVPEGAGLSSSAAL